ncbi:MAG TPA: right-handed parallel beta-helix repeat-containing protein [Armatimonadota bacterium]
MAVRLVYVVLSLALVWTAGSLHIGAPPSAATTTLYVAPWGSDSNPGTQSQPLNSLVKARDRVREALAAGTVKGDYRVLLRGGDYWVRDGFRLDSQDSMPPGLTCTYSSAPGEWARLIGGAKCGRFTLESGKTYQTDMVPGYRAQQLFRVSGEDLQRVRRASTPTSGWARVPRNTWGGSQNSTTLTYGQLDSDPSSWATDAGSLDEKEVLAWPGNGWYAYSQRLPAGALEGVARHNLRTRATVTGWTVGNRFRIENVYEARNQAGTCVLSWADSRHKVYLNLGGLDPNDGTYVQSTAGKLLHIQGGATPVRGLAFERLYLWVSNGHGVYLRNARDIALRDCELRGGNQDGVYVDQDTHSLVVSGCHISEFGGTGVCAKAPSYPVTASITDVSIENCNIHHCGWRAGSNGLVLLNNVQRGTVKNCHLHHAPRYGVLLLGDNWWDGQYSSLMAKGARIFDDRHREADQARDCTISYNLIHDVVNDSPDAGAIHTSATGSGNLIEHNWVENCGHTNSGEVPAKLCYTDDGSAWLKVQYNLFRGLVVPPGGTGASALLLLRGHDNLYLNNIFHATTSVGQLVYLGKTPDRKREAQGLRLERNLFLVSSGANSPIFNQGGNWDSGILASVDRNLWWAFDGAPLVFAGMAPSPNWAGWRGTGRGKTQVFDPHGANADPKCVDPAKGDYSFGPGSPALDPERGIAPLSRKGVGLTSSYPDRFARN